MIKIKNNRTKIVATIGPSSSSYKTLKNLIINGVDVVRLNFSHGIREDHKKIIKNVRRISDELSVPVAILQDLQGPKIRVGNIENGKLTLKDESEIDIEAGNSLCNSKKISLDNDIINDVEENERILLDDGKIELKVIKKIKKKFVVKVIRGGVLKSRKGVNFPDSNLNLSSITKKDIDDLNFGLDNDIDWVALSFVRTDDDIIGLRKLIKKFGAQDRTKIIAKIEKPQAIKNIDKIIDSSDGLMVARGDLGVELPMETGSCSSEKNCI